jgi:ADP-ribosylglycohydrolase
VSAVDDSLAGLSVGDALGAQFFIPGRSVATLLSGEAPPSPWEWTDDTEMACSIVAELRAFGSIDQVRLATAFAMRCEPYRGYGGGAVATLHQIRDGVHWAEAAGAAFGGVGSLGNGAAMRVAPLGAFFGSVGAGLQAFDAARPAVDVAAFEAIKSAEVTHAHPEAIAGAIAVAVAACRAVEFRSAGARPDFATFLDLPHLIDGRVSAGVRRASSFGQASVAEAAYVLGNGASVLSHETVPFTLWTAARFLDDYPAAILACIEAGGDVDTTAAIVGGIVAAYTGVGVPGGVPLSWLEAREPLPDWCDSTD